MSNGFYFGMGGVPSVYDEYPDEQPILIDGYELDLDTLTAGGELVTIEEFTEAANDAGLDKDIMEDCLEELRVLWQEREEEEASMSFSDPAHIIDHIPQGLRHETNYSKATARAAARRHKQARQNAQAFFMRAPWTRLDAHQLSSERWPSSPARSSLEHWSNE